MAIHRRDFLAYSAALVCVSLIPGAALAFGGKKRRGADPDSGAFQAGDFLFPKEPDDWVPLKAEWEAMKLEYLRTELDARRAQVIEEMDYEEFREYYAGSRLGPFYVGHVAILERDEDGHPWIIEAISDGVLRVPYEDWREERNAEHLWHARLRDFEEKQRAEIAAEARRQVGKPYGFFNFDLEDDRSFYCSKLAWYSVKKKLGLALDGNPDPRRNIWFTPKQMIQLRALELLKDQGEYKKGGLR